MYYGAVIYEDNGPVKTGCFHYRIPANPRYSAQGGLFRSFIMGQSQLAVSRGRVLNRFSLFSIASGLFLGLYMRHKAGDKVFPTVWFGRLPNRFYAWWKHGLSYLKSDWTIHDYPVRARKQNLTEYDIGRLENQPGYYAYIVNWSLIGFGTSPSDARTALATKFEEVKRSRLQDGLDLPRPGQQVPIVFASSRLMDHYPELVDDFISRVLGLDWAFVSDESTLWDFHTELSNNAMFKKIEEVYGVDVSDVESGNISRIIARIATTSDRTQ